MYPITSCIFNAFLRFSIFFLKKLKKALKISEAISTFLKKPIGLGISSDFKLVFMTELKNISFLKYLRKYRFLSVQVYCNTMTV